MIRLELAFDRVSIIDRSLHRLEQFQKNTLEGFILDADDYAIAEHHLRTCLEAAFEAYEK